MTNRTKGITVALLQVVLVGSLGAKLLIERSTLPRVWVEVAPYDPDLPIRGRYVSLRLRVSPRGFPDPSEDRPGWDYAVLSVEDDMLIATPAGSDRGHRLTILGEGGALTATLDTPVAYFIAEHAEDPSNRSGLMVEVTVPRRGPPRPIRLGIREGDTISPLEF